MSIQRVLICFAAAQTAGGTHGNLTDTFVNYHDYTVCPCVHPFGSATTNTGTDRLAAGHAHVAHRRQRRAHAQAFRRDGLGRRQPLPQHALAHRAQVRAVPPYPTNGH